MTDDLVARIQRAYPKGNIVDADESVLHSPQRDERLAVALELVGVECGLRYHINAFDKPAFQIALTQAEHPLFAEWTARMSIEEQLSWIHEHRQPYPVLWLKVSRVADYYLHYFNFWIAGQGERKIDIDFKRNPDVAWSTYELAIKRKLEKNGFCHLPHELGMEKTPFVEERDYDSIPDDDPRWDHEGFEPPLVPSCVFTCLFGE